MHERSVTVVESANGSYGQFIMAGSHMLGADEPVELGGRDTGPDPYELLLSALGACTCAKRACRQVRAPDHACQPVDTRGARETSRNCGPMPGQPNASAQFNRCLVARRGACGRRLEFRMVDSSATRACRQLSQNNTQIMATAAMNVFASLS